MAHSFPHFRRHIHAVWRHLPDDIRGADNPHRKHPSIDRDDIWMVGSHQDIDLADGRRVIYVEHGAGQAYWGDPTSSGHPSYHGVEHPKNVIGYISPRPDVADSWGRPAFAAGCPALDDIEAEHERVAVISFHWDAHMVCPEARSAKAYYLDDLHTIVAYLRRRGYEVIGHGHPRDRKWRLPFIRLGVPVEADVDVVLRRAGLLLCDNSSIMFEAAHLGIPVIALNAPWYRRDVEHGLRFWQWCPGDQIDNPMDLLDIDPTYGVWNATTRFMGEMAATYAYGTNPGGAAAANWVTDLIAEM